MVEVEIVLRSAASFLINCFSPLPAVGKLLGSAPFLQTPPPPPSLSLPWLPFLTQNIWRAGWGRGLHDSLININLTSLEDFKQTPGGVAELAAGLRSQISAINIHVPACRGADQSSWRWPSVAPHLAVGADYGHVGRSLPSHGAGGEHVKL